MCTRESAQQNIVYPAKTRKYPMIDRGGASETGFDAAAIGDKKNNNNKKVTLKQRPPPESTQGRTIIILL